jgi:hypothetical protein
MPPAAWTLLLLSVVVALSYAPRVADAALQYDYLNVYSCPPGYCLDKRCVRVRALWRRSARTRRGGVAGAHTRTRARSEQSLNFASLAAHVCARARRPLQSGFVGPAASFVECRRAAGAAPSGVAVTPSNGDTQRPTVSNAVYSPAARSTSSGGGATAVLCTASGALAARLGGGERVAYALTVYFGGAENSVKAPSSCAGPPEGAPLRLDGTCRAAAGGGKPFRRDTLPCVAGASATVRARAHIINQHARASSSALCADVAFWPGARRRRATTRRARAAACRWRRTPRRWACASTGAPQSALRSRRQRQQAPALRPRPAASTERRCSSNVCARAFARNESIA